MNYVYFTLFGFICQENTPVILGVRNSVLTEQSNVITETSLPVLTLYFQMSVCFFVGFNKVVNKREEHFYLASASSVR